MSIILKNVVFRSKALKPVLKLNEGSGEGVVNHPEVGEGWSFTLKAAWIQGEWRGEGVFKDKKYKREGFIIPRCKG